MVGEEKKRFCAQCSKVAEQRCAGCYSVYYCSRDHQKQHWKVHKSECKPFQICEDATLGRHLVAIRAIKAGEVILKEPPIIRGPIQQTGPVCLGCNRALHSPNECKPCSKCGWPMCSEKCEKSAEHLPECNYTSQRGYKVTISNFVAPHPNYQCLTVLRCLYQRDNNPEKWESLIGLESHEKTRLNTEQYEQDKVAAKFIQKFFKLDSIFTEEEIMKVAGIVQVNSHEVPLTEPPHLAIYKTCSLFEHNCRANCSKSFTARGDILISAGVDIAPGEHLSFSYVDPLWGTANRRHFLAQSKFFDCTCTRCTDPTEFGTMFNAMKCNQNGCEGYLLPKTFITEKLAEDDPATLWNCNKCSNQKSTDQIQNILDRIGTDLQAMEKDNVENCQKFLEYYGKQLHTSHFYMTDVRLALAQLIGQKGSSGLTQVPEELLELKAKCCRQISDLLETLIPAETRIRGTMLFELHAAIAELGRRRATNGKVGPETLEAMLVESKKILSEAAELLKHEPEILPEGKIKLQAKQNLLDMEKLLCTLHHNVGDTL